MPRSTPRATARTRRSDGARTHDLILEAAARLASVEGIHGLTLGRLAEVLGVSKSGLYAHFGSKEQLQIETIEAALATFGREVMEATGRAPEGIARLEALASAYFSYLERWVFPGGCFFASLLAEADARAGTVHTLVVRIERQWQEEMIELVRAAQRRGEISTSVDAAQLAFEIYACFELANFHFVLFRDRDVLARGRRAVAGLLERSRTLPHLPSGPRQRRRRRR